ncbi:hypothetical protein RRG08_010619 [Elysia crispata]|uniref:5'-nucleotidase n=1 Tax=Elysia crispata TaxID=231223 RepID=A0AAE1ALL3_9GAST|nr:hypothetical protein RRG08_010619 [Elysia crispata]
MKYLGVWVVLLMQGLCVLPVVGYDLLILHTNDFHDRVEETNKYSGYCRPQDATAGKCFGGVSRIKSKVDEQRRKYENILLLDGGDQFQGTLWFYEFGGELLSHFMNLIGYDAIGLGNHEFDNGVEGLVPFVDNATFRILSSNIDLSNTPVLQGKIQRSAKFDIGGETIGVIGYTTTDTTYISNPGSVKFTDELTAVQAEADKLMADGVNKIIAVGHQGFGRDRDMASNLRGVDVIVGGHSNTFLYTGDAPSNEDPLGDYPFVTQTSATGETVLVVQDYAFGKYLGSLHVTFDNDGKVTSYHGNPILLDASVPKDNETETIVQSLLPQILAMQSEPIGSSHVFLEGDAKVCRTRECNMGNFICDGMLKQNLRHSDARYWSDVSIAVMNSGGIRTSIDKGPITVGDAIKVQPFRNTVDIVELRGESVLKILEHAASLWSEESDRLFGGFLQVSGMRIVYDMSQATGSRVIDVQMMCSKCSIPHFEPLNVTEIYQIVMNNYIANGGDTYTMIPTHTVRRHTIGNVDLDIFTEHIRQNSPVIQGLEGRIRFVQDLMADGLTSKLVKQECPKCAVKSTDSAPGVAVSSTLVVLGLLGLALWAPLVGFFGSRVLYVSVDNSQRHVSDQYGSSNSLSDQCGSSNSLSDQCGSSNSLSDQCGSSNSLSDRCGSSNSLSDRCGSSNSLSDQCGSSNSLSDRCGSSNSLSDRCGSSNSLSDRCGSSNSLSDRCGSSNSLSDR